MVSFGGRPAPLRAPDAHLGLEVLHGYRIVRGEKDRGPWKVTTAYYLYSLLDDQNQELIGFHWHPEGRGPHSEPHAQLGPGLDLGIPEMLKARIPTPRLSLEEVIRLAIETFDLVPLRPDWDAILRRNQRAFQEWKMR